MIVRELITALGFEIDDKKLDAFESKVNQVRNGLIGLSAVTIGAAGTLYAFVKSSANAADHVFKLAGIAGVAVEDMQRLGHVAEVSGSSVEELASGLKFLSKNLFEASKNANSESGKLFRSLGVRAKDAQGNLRSTSDVILEVSDKFSKLPNRAAKAALAMQVFGRGGGGLVEFLDQGSDSIREIAAELDAFGGVLSEEKIRTLKDFNDAISRALGILSAIRNVVAVELAPGLTASVNQFRKWLVANKDLVKSNVLGFMRALSSFLRIIFKSLRAVASAVAYLTDTFGGAEKVVKALLYAIGLLSAASVLAGIYNVVKAFRALGIAMNLAFLKPLAIAALLIAAAGAIFLVIEDIVGYFQGKKSLTGVFIDKILEGIELAKAKLTEFLDFLTNGGFMKKLIGGEEIMQAFDFLKEQFLAFKEWLSGLNLIDSIIGVKGLKDLFADFKNTQVVPQGVKDAAGGFFDGLIGADMIKGLLGIGTSPAAATPTGIAPGNLPGTNGVNTSQVIINTPITVSVPAGTDPASVGERVQLGVSDGIASILRQAHRATS